MIFDSHAHYDDEAFNVDRESILTSMQSNGVGRIVNIGASLETSKKSIELSEKYDYIYAAVGVHPSETKELNEENFKLLKEYLKKDKVVAVGEIGLDYYYEDTDRDTQIKWFYKQLDLAAEMDMPVVIHSRDAAADTMNILKEYKGRLSGGVIHCYSYSQEMAKEFVKMGYYIGVGGVLTFNNAKKLKETATDIPLEKIVIETDCPYLSPVPYRGKRNTSPNLSFVVEELSKIKGINKEKVEKITYDNAMKLYRMNY